MPLYDKEADLSVPGTALTVRYTLWDVLAAAVAAGTVFFFLTIWSHPLMHPSMWQDVSVACGLRPPIDIHGGLWTFLVSLVYKMPGTGTGEAALSLAGRIAVACSTFAIYMFCRAFLFIAMRRIVRRRRRAWVMQRYFSFIATLCFAFSAPVWQMGQMFSQETLTLFLVSLCLLSFMLFLGKGSMTALYFAVFLVGVLVADSPVMLIPAALMWLAYYTLTRHVFAFDTPLSDLSVEQASRWHLTILLLLGFGLVVSANILVFIFHNGVGPLGTSASAVPMKFFSGYLAMLTGGASTIGWVMFLAIVLFPFLFCVAMLPASTDEERLLPYGMGFTYIVCALLAMSQLFGFSKMWIWDLTWVTGVISGVAMESRELVMLVVLFSTVTLLAAMAVLGTEFYCRNHRLVVSHLFGPAEVDENTEREVRDQRPMLKFFSSVLQFLAPLALVAAVIFGCVWRCRQQGERKMLSLIRNYVNAVLVESEGCDVIVTDGFFDPLLEVLAARVQKRDLCAISTLPDDSQYARFLRERVCKTPDDKLALVDSKTPHPLLKKWLSEKDGARIGSVAVENGLEVWMQMGLPYPAVGGTLARASWRWDEPIVAQARANAVALSREIVKCYEKHDAVDSCTDAALRKKFFSAQFALMIAARYRSDWEDHMAVRLSSNREKLLPDGVPAVVREMRAQQYSALAHEDRDLKNLLEVKNPIVQELEQFERQRNQMAHRQLTPRERLQLCMIRDAYEEAYPVALVIRKSFPNDYDANFALAMFYSGRGQWARAEEFFKRCLNVRPGNPRILNNIAFTQLKMRKFDAATQNINLALDVEPGSAPYLNTAKQIETARKEAAEEQAKSAAGDAAKP